MKVAGFEPEFACYSAKQLCYVARATVHLGTVPKIVQLELYKRAAHAYNGAT